MFDADGHIFESQTEIFKFLEDPFRGKTNLLHTPFFPAFDDWNRTALSIAGNYPEGSNSSRGEEGKPEQWLQVLDELGMEGTVLYPTAAMTIGQVKEQDWAAAVSTAYNNWLHHKFLSENPRLKGMAIIPTINPRQAAQEMRRVAAELKGMVGFFISAGVQRPLGDRFYDPIYATARELNMMIAVHAGGPGHRLDMMDRAIMARCLGHPTSQMIQMTHMMFSGVFERFSEVRFAFMEAGIGWLLFNLDRMEEAYEQWSYETPELTRSPREYLTGGQLFFHCETDEMILPYAIEALGDAQLLYASDYPHIAPDEVASRLRKFQAREDLAASSKARILGDNARRLYRL
ncbi:MAG TPA: amidohydrolase family protein [Candidatus Binataceae bacterium]|nr:amidohydrolase family protein [Candidatus Binataceae bacterium]